MSLTKLEVKQTYCYVSTVYTGIEYLWVTLLYIELYNRNFRFLFTKCLYRARMIIRALHYCVHF
jgi:hypothetical protein